MEKIVIPDVDSSQESLNHLLIDVAERMNEIIDKLTQPNNTPDRPLNFERD